MFEKYRLFFFSAACFIAVGLLWIGEEFEAAASHKSGEKDFGVGILAMAAVGCTVVLVPLGLVFLTGGIARMRHDRRRKRTMARGRLLTSGAAHRLGKIK